MNAHVVIDLFAIQAAAARALLCEQNKSLTTNSLHSELVYNLSASRNVTESFRRFGISDQSDALIVGVFDDPSQDKLSAIASRIDGQRVSMDTLGQHLSEQDLVKIKKYYKIQQPEHQFSLSDAIITRIAIKSCAK